MKRIFAYITMLTLAVACETMYGPVETPLTPDSAQGVTVTVNEAGDETVKFTLAPADGTSYYSYLVEMADAASELDPETLYKVGYADVAQGTFKYTEEAKTQVVELDGLYPATTYQIYAVAGSPMGIPSAVSVVSFTTSDKVSPALADYGEYEGPDGVTGVGLVFDELVVRGTGDLVLKYYAMNSAEIAEGVELGQVTVPADSVTVEDNVVMVSVPELPAGAFYALDYPEGAFTDPSGNKVAALSSKVYYGEETNYEPYYAGVGNRYPVVEWTFKDLPEGIADWTLPVVLTPDSKYGLGYCYEEDLALAYMETGRTVSFELVYNEDYGFIDGTLAAWLPEEPAKGAAVELTVPAGAFEDYYGNLNAEWTGKSTSLYDMTVPFEDITGSYVMTETSAYTGEAYPSPMMIEKSDNPVYGNVMLTTYAGFECNVSPIYGCYDPAAGTLTFPSQQIFAEVDLSETEKGYLAFVSCTVSSSGSVGIGDTGVVFSVPEPNVIAGVNYYYGVLVLDAEMTPATFYDVYYTCAASLAPAAEPASRYVSWRTYPLGAVTLR